MSKSPCGLLLWTTTRIYTECSLCIVIASYQFYFWKRWAALPLGVLQFLNMIVTAHMTDFLDKKKRLDK